MARINDEEILDTLSLLSMIDELTSLDYDVSNYSYDLFNRKNNSLIVSSLIFDKNSLSFKLGKENLYGKGKGASISFPQKDLISLFKGTNETFFLLKTPINVNPNCFSLYERAFMHEIHAFYKNIYSKELEGFCFCISNQEGKISIKRTMMETEPEIIAKLPKVEDNSVTGYHYMLTPVITEKCWYYYNLLNDTISLA